MNSDRELHVATRRSLIRGGIASMAGAAGFLALKKIEPRVLGWNGKLWHATLSDQKLSPTFPRSDVRFLKPNGDIGMTGDLDDWDLQVTAAGADLSLGMDDIRALPKHEMITRFCCIEGWDTVVQWGGARFSDFTRKYFPPGKPLPAYVSMTSVDGDYYVGLDMKSAMHPQTLLAYEMNGEPLAPVHGAPLRLAIPVKYGIKNIKKIGAIVYTDKRPDDYWAEEGYDWFAGL